MGSLHSLTTCSSTLLSLWCCSTDEARSVDSTDALASFRAALQPVTAVFLPRRGGVKLPRCRCHLFPWNNRVQCLGFSADASAICSERRPLKKTLVALAAARVAGRTQQWTRAALTRRHPHGRRLGRRNRLGGRELITKSCSRQHRRAAGPPSGGFGAFEREWAPKLRDSLPPQRPCQCRGRRAKVTHLDSDGSSNR